MCLRVVAGLHGNLENRHIGLRIHGEKRHEGAMVEAAGAKTLVIFHHDPSHDDDFMDEVARQAEAARPGTVVAREGMTLRP